MVIWNLGPRGRLALLDFLAWMRRQRILQGIFQFAPRGIRSWASGMLSEPALRRLRFPPLPVNVGHLGGPGDSVQRSTDGVRGVNIFGYFRGQFGLGESARVYARALMAAGYPVALHDIDIELPHDTRDTSLQSFMRSDAPYGINLIFVNPDYMRQAFDSLDRQKLEGRHTIACWFWELERVPDAWLWALDAVDEIIVASNFVGRAFRDVTDKPVLRVPLPLPDTEDSGASRQDFGLPSDKFVFLTTFDFHSSIHRKNPFAAIAAFRAAFPSGRNDVRLLVKSSNGHHHPEALRHLISIAVEDPRVIVRDQVLDRAHMKALQRCADAYVSLHRAEGFGLGMAECMAMGKPVIGTAWSGNLDFMTPENSCLVDYQLVKVEQGEYQHANGARWADPSISQAAGFMRQLVDDPSFARDVGKRAAADISRTLSPALAARALIGRFETLYAGNNEHTRSVPND